MIEKYMKISKIFRRNSAELEHDGLHAKLQKSKLATPGIAPGSERRCSRYV